MYVAFSQSTCSAHGAARFASPILVPMAHTDKENVAIIFEPMDNEMGLEWMDAHGWR